MTSFSNTFQRIAVVGAGAWGTTLAYHLARQNVPIRLWAYEPQTVDAIQQTRCNTLFLPGVTLPDCVQPTSSLSHVAERADVIVMAVPSHAMRLTIRQLRDHLHAPVPVVIATKGIEEGTLCLMSQVLADELSPSWAPMLTVLTGPSFAAEVCAEKPTTILVAGQTLEIVAALQELLMTPQFRVYSAQDMIGAQLGGALKNVMAIASGIVDGLQLGLNARAALITRGLAEMIRLGLAMGAEVQTFYGLSGLGDLVLTCTGNLSRNHAVGVKLGQRQSLPEILEGTATVAEGVNTAKAAVGLATRYDVDMPIVRAVHSILFEGRSPQDAVKDLMTRASKMETEGHALAETPRAPSEFQRR